MTYITEYPSPVGVLTIASDGEAITGLWISGQKHFGDGAKPPFLKADDHPVLLRAAEYLDVYFRSEEPDLSTLVLKPAGTPFQQKVLSCLLEIPYGQTVTYGDIAKKLALQSGVRTMSAQAVGNAVGRNPISIFIPCHRVVGSGGKLTGYAGGLEAKQTLLQLEAKKRKTTESK